LIEDEPTRLTQQLALPIERALRAAGAEASLESVSEVACSFAGRDHQFLLPAGVGAPDTDASSDATALESDSEVAFIYPANPELQDALVKAAADPATYRHPNSVRLAAHDAEAAGTRLTDGSTLFTARAFLDRPSSGRWRTALAAYYRVRWKGADEAIFVLSRTYGGLGRLAEAVSREREKGSLVGVARGGAFGSPTSDASGRAAVDALERAGLQYSAVAGSEIEHWQDLADYRRERPDGVRFLSANLFYSTAAALSPAPAAASVSTAAVSASSAAAGVALSSATASTGPATALPPYAVFEASGTRVALVGLTPAWGDKLLAQVGVSGLTVADPVSTLEALIPRLRREADVVVALGALGPADEARLAASIRGLDLIIADDAPFLLTTPPPATTIAQDDRPAFANPLPPIRVYSPALNVLEVDRKQNEDRSDWWVSQRAVVLDDSISPLDGFPEPALEAFAAGRSTEPAVLPEARDVFPPSERGGRPAYEDRDFWTLSAGLLAQRLNAEAGLLLAPILPVQTVGAVPPSLVRAWLAGYDYAVTVGLSGADLKKLAAEADDAKKREDGDLPPTGRPRFVVSGLDDKGRVRGAPLDAAGTYRIATSRATADALGLAGPYGVVPGTPTVSGLALAELRAHADVSTSTWRDWMGGRPISEPGLWRVNFRDISLNIRDTKTDASIAFANVVNTRVQSADELYIGGDLKTDVDYLHDDYKWTNTLEMAYSKDRIAANGSPAVTSLTDNRIMLMTLGTQKEGTTPYKWLAQSWGPSLGFEFDSQFQPTPGLPLQQVYSAFPGVEFYDGSVFKTIELGGVVKYDASRSPPNLQEGVRARAVLSAPLGSHGAKVDGEFWNNYYFLAPDDNASDLRIEGDVNAKLSIPVRKYLTVAPFVDFDWFELKITPTWGYSVMTGISIGFSRLWKPQYESF
jgi:hypothetical protein